MQKLLNATGEDYQYLVDKEHSKLFAVNKDQIVIFQAWHQDSSQKSSTLKEIEIMDNLTEIKWDHLYNSYISQKTHTTLSHPAITGIPSYKQEPKLKVFLKDLSTTIKNTMDWTKYRSKFVSTLTTKGHQHVID